MNPSRADLYEHLGTSGADDGTKLNHWRQVLTKDEYISADSLGGTNPKWYRVRGDQITAISGEPSGFGADIAADADNDDPERDGPKDEENVGDRD